MQFYLVYQRNAQTPLEYYIPISVFFCVLASNFIMVLAWSLENKLKLLLTTTAILFSLIMIEAFTYSIDINKICSPNAHRARVAKKLGIDFDNRSKFQIMNELRSQGKDVWSNISPQYFVDSDGLELAEEKFFPLSAGVSKVSTILCNENGKFTWYNSDEHGFNNPAGLYQKDVDVLIIGDSFTHGACVNQSEDIASYLRLNTKLNVLNLGNSGVGPLVELAILTEYAAKIKPKKVFWLYFEGNDLLDLTVESKSSFLLNYLNDQFSQNLFDRQPQVDSVLIDYLTNKNQEFLERYNPPRAKISLKGIIKLQNLRKILGLNKIKSEMVLPSKALYELILKTAQRRVNAWGGELIFVYLPELQRYKTENISFFDEVHQKKDIFLVLEDLGIPFINLDLAFQKHPDPLSLFPMRLEGHYTSQGYNLVANELACHLKEEQTVCTN